MKRNIPARNVTVQRQCLFYPIPNLLHRAVQRKKAACRLHCSYIFYNSSECADYHDQINAAALSPALCCCYAAGRAGAVLGVI